MSPELLALLAAFAALALLTWAYRRWTNHRELERIDCERRQRLAHIRRTQRQAESHMNTLTMQAIQQMAESVIRHQKGEHR